MTPDPRQNFLGDLHWTELSSIYDLAAPRKTSHCVRVPHVPLHFFPPSIDDHIRTISVVPNMMAHPLRKHDMLRNQFTRVAALGESLALFFPRDIQQTY